MSNFISPTRLSFFFQLSITRRVTSTAYPIDDCTVIGDYTFYDMSALIPASPQTRINEANRIKDAILEAAGPESKRPYSDMCEDAALLFACLEV